MLQFDRVPSWRSVLLTACSVAGIGFGGSALARPISGDKAGQMEKLPCGLSYFQNPPSKGEKVISYSMGNCGNVRVTKGILLSNNAIGACEALPPHSQDAGSFFMNANDRVLGMVDCKNPVPEIRPGFVKKQEAPVSTFKGTAPNVEAGKKLPCEMSYFESPEVASTGKKIKRVAWSYGNCDSHQISIRLTVDPPSVSPPLDPNLLTCQTVAPHHQYAYRGALNGNQHVTGWTIIGCARPGDADTDARKQLP